MDNLIITEKCSTIRMLARESLRGLWLHGFTGLLIYNLAVSVPITVLIWLSSSFYFLAGLYMLLVMGPFTLGISVFVLSILRNSGSKVSQVFCGFERFGQAAGLFLMVGLIVILWSFITFPIMMLIIATESLMAIPLLLVAMIPAFIAMIRYSQVFFILADDPGIGIFECLRRSKSLMAGNKMKYFLLNLSFLGWSIVAALPQVVMEMMFPIFEVSSLAGVIMLSVIPSLGIILLNVYIFTCTAVFYDIVSGNLRSGCITSTAEIISQKQLTGEQDTAQESEQINRLQTDSR